MPTRSDAKVSSDSLKSSDFMAVVDAIAAEKSFNKETLCKIVESSLTAAVQFQYGGEKNLIVKLHKNGELLFFTNKTVVDEQEFVTSFEVVLSKARKEKSSAEIGETVLIPMPKLELNYTTLNHARKLVATEVQKYEKEMEYIALQKLENEIVTGVVKKLYPSGMLINIGKFEAYISKYNLLPMEYNSLTPGSKINALVETIRRDDSRPQATLTRTSDKFLVKFLTQEIREIEEGEIEIKSVARDPGSRSKIAVLSKSSSLDPIAVCIGLKGKKIASTMKELNGERIDVIKWSQDPAEFIVNALKNVKIINIVVDYERTSLDVVISAQDISLSIGRKGQNTRLLSKMLNWSVHFLTDEENSKKKLEDFESKTAVLLDKLNLDEVVAQLLVVEGLNTVQKISEASISDLIKIEGFDESISEAIKDRATETQKIIVKETEEKNKKNTKIAEGLIDNFKDCTIETLMFFIDKEIDTLEKIAELSIDEAREDYRILESHVPRELLSNIIIQARERVYNI